MDILSNSYTFVMGSDLERDGMYLEAQISGAPEKVVAEVFYSDTSHELTVSCFEEALPIELLEHLISEGRRRLPPKERS